jgi:hypothetical protein
MASTAARVVIPDGLDFSALRLQRHSDNGDISFDWAPIAAICAASGLDLELFGRGPEDNVAALITAWYVEHLARGGRRDAVQDELLSEVRAEDEHGGGLSHPPGRA